MIFYCDKCQNDLSEQNINKAELVAGVTIYFIFCPRCGKRYKIVLHDALSDAIRKGNDKKVISEKLKEHQRVLECVYEEEIKQFIGS